MNRFDFTQVDVFTEAPLQGNPLAVVHGADALEAERMQAFARWTNLSETTFLLAPTDPAADYRVRIFTPGGELPFAGHPTLGSCHAWLEQGGRPRTPGVVVQECGVGLVHLRLDGTRAAFAAPKLERADVDADDRAAVLAALGVPADRLVAAQWLKNGPRWLSLLLDSAETVLAIVPDAAAMKRFASVGVAGPHRAGSETVFEVRGFVGRPHLYEDPVTGSLNAGLAQWLIGAGRAPSAYVASQGTRLGRAGRVHITKEGETVWVGGRTVSVVRGSVSF
ncbi:MAG TPA: PhzF family phenazine biosynthesis protein [Caldimonas sp.]|jgi:PhzF family phenazine biosynthesis protein|nr:PhzF family phenazine biosynthesis protein [Caldimonas sp.]HEX2542501.1 PhzF family phenazine biosynthesis protein [Caldimonas sp.]